MSITLAFSICPNDIYLYSGLLSGAISNSYQFKTAEISELNSFAINRQADIIKVSAGLIPELTDHYQLSGVGASFGIHSGPKLVVRKEDSNNLNINGQLVVTPGLNTTASLVTKLLYPGVKLEQAELKKIPFLVKNGLYRCGLVINESMGTLENFDLKIREDLALTWMNLHQQPLPLGMVIIGKNLKPEIGQQFESDVKHSIDWARSHHDRAMDLVRQFCPESTDEARFNHIKQFTSLASEFSVHKSAVDYFLTQIDLFKIHAEQNFRR